MLSTGELLLNQSVTVVGPGQNVLAVDGNAASRVFHVTNGVTVAISGLTITNGAATGNFPTNGGGGIYNDHSTLTVSNCAINGSSASGGGGGIYNDHSTLRLVNSTVGSNSAPGVLGGGIYNNGSGGSATLTLISSILAGNSAFDGGGIFNNGESSGTGIVSVTTSTFSGNSAGNGGGIWNDGTSSGSATLVVNGSTFSGNSAGTGGGILNDGAGATLQIGDTILNIGGASGANVFNIIGAVSSQGYNLCSDSGAGFFTNATDQITTDPKLGPLADNGGPTWTHALLWGSPAIDQGKSFGITTDQRGQPRPFDFSSITNDSGGDGSDIGAFEFAARHGAIQPDLYNPSCDESQPGHNLDQPGHVPGQLQGRLYLQRHGHSAVSSALLSRGFALRNVPAFSGRRQREAQNDVVVVIGDGDGPDTADATDSGREFAQMKAAVAVAAHGGDVRAVNIEEVGAAGR